MTEHNFAQPDSYLWELPIPEAQSSVQRELTWSEGPCRLAQARLEGVQGEKISIFAGSDYVALGVYQAAEQLGLKVGRDIFIVGFGDMPLCHRLDPPLSSVYHFYDRLGYETAKLLHQELVGGVRQPVHRFLPVELRVRASSTGGP